MLRTILIICITMILFSGLTLLAGDNPAQTEDSAKAVQVVEKSATTTSAPIETSLIGTWVYVPDKYILDGEITFNEDGTYTKSELDKDSVRAGLTAHYVLDKSSQPYKIQLCLGECGAPGSEWTTSFGIVRFLTEDSLEIKFSPDGNYPVEFSPEKERYTTFMNRKPVEEKTEKLEKLEK